MFQTITTYGRYFSYSISVEHNNLGEYSKENALLVTVKG